MGSGNGRKFSGALIFAAVCAAATVSRAVDPGVRPGPLSAGGAVAGVNPQYFANVRRAFNQVYSIAGDLESGAGLGPRFNGTSCGGCHAYPAAGGASPKENPQLAMAAAHGARNAIPPFLKPDGPVLALRSLESGEVLPLFTVTGRSDAYGCAVPQPDFSNLAKLGFRIPTPLFGAGLIDNIPDAAILANRDSRRIEKEALGIGGRPSLDSTGRIGRFGWQAQHHSLAGFAEEAYRIEMGVRGARASYEPACSALYQAAYLDPNNSTSYDESEQSFTFLVTEYMRFLDAPHPRSGSAGRGGRLFDSIGCALCHTASLHTGKESDLASLNDREAPLFSDLLLHRMGAKPSDEFRTAPLWGLGQRVFLLHDGRTTDLAAAIRDHGGEADQVIARFERLSPAEQQELLNFLRSL
jgi:CxxC motif-containing protein (DUF1111 family)